MKRWRQKARGLLTCAICLVTLTFIAQPGLTTAKSVRTSLKRYAVHSFGGQKVLCEPYKVTRNDWLYKIFRQKGEISEKDFPLFLAIFKSINPDISNIDAINPGQQILIPLKMIDQEDFDESVPGVVDVPVVELAALEKQTPFRYKRHRVKGGDTVSRLIDPFFLKKDGTLTQQGIDLFLIANPGINRVDLIQEGSFLNLPIPNLAAPDAHGAPFIPSPITSKTVAALEQYSQLHRGKLVWNGKYYFPAKGSLDLVIDLAYTPLIRFQNGTRIIMVPDRIHYREMEKTVRVYWPDVTLVDIHKALETLTPSAHDPPGEKPPGNSRETALDHRARAAMLVKLAGFEYKPDSVIRLQTDALDIEIKVGKVLRREKPDLLLEFGDVYGFALDLINDQGYEFISLLPGETMQEHAVKLFTGLDIQGIKNPAFISTRTYRTITIPGIYIPCPTGEIMLVDQGLDLETEEFLRQRSISILRTDLPYWGGKPET